MFRLLDRLILKELFGPWILGVVLFSVILLAGTYLFRLTELVVSGVDVMTVIQLSLYYAPGLIVKTFPMAMLLSAMLAFGRLSNDSEIVASVASGANLFDMMRPVVLFGIGVSLLAFSVNEFVVPGTSMKAVTLQDKIVKQLAESSGTPHHQPLFQNGKLKGQIVARDVSLDSGRMFNVLIEWYKPDGKPAWIVIADSMDYTPEKEWVIKKGQVIHFQEDGMTTATFEQASPPEGAKFEFTPKDVFTVRNKDPDALSMRELSEQIRRLSANPLTNEARLRDLEVSFWSKITVPLSGLVFGLVGAPAAIRRTRQSFGVGMAASVGIIFGYYMFHNYMTIIAKGGIVPPLIGAFMPLILGMIAAVVLLVQKNR